MSQPGKIRLGLIGLNAPFSGTPTGTSWAANAHLPYLKISSKYQLVALQNSSVERAEKAIKAYDLDPKVVKAYGTPEDLASDVDVDLVVSSIRVDRHGASLIPSIKAGKDVFVEWPIEANYIKAKELTDLVKTHNVRNCVGLQGGFAPVVQKVKSIIESGEIGTVGSSTFIAKNPGGPTISSNIDYFIDKKVGGNPLSIGFGHLLEVITAALGDFSHHQSLLVNQFPEVDVIDPITKEIIEKGRKNDVPNQIVFNAVLNSGAVLTFKLHNSAILSPQAQLRKDAGQTPALDWRIFGSKGELRITNYETWSLNAGGQNTKLEIYKADKGELSEVDVGTDEFEHLPLRARNIARLYEKFATDEVKAESQGWYPDFEYALKTHKLIEQLYKENGL